MNSTLRLLIAVLSLTGWHAADAGEEVVSGTVQSIAPAALSISVRTATGEVRQFDLLKKVKVIINGEAAALTDLRPGQQVTATWNTDLEVVTALAASGEGIAAPELSALSELPNPKQSKGSPWVSADGLTLYWKAVPGGESQSWVYRATRKTPSDLFGNVEKVIPGNDPTVSQDGLEMVVLTKDKLLTSSRATLADAFSRPQTLTDFTSYGFHASPCLSGDGMKLYTDRLDFENKTVTQMVSTRLRRGGKWSAPQPVEFAGWSEARQRFMYVTADGLFALTTVEGRPGDSNENRMVVWKGDGSGTRFHSPAIIELNGQPLRGKFPRYLPSTRELFFVHTSPDTKVDEIMLVRGFNPEFHIRPVMGN